MAPMHPTFAKICRDLTGILDDAFAMAKQSEQNDTVFGDINDRIQSYFAPFAENPASREHQLFENRVSPLLSGWMENCKNSRLMGAGMNYAAIPILKKEILRSIMDYAMHRRSGN